LWGSHRRPQWIRVKCETKLRYYIDTEDLRPGDDWGREFRSHARTSAFLALRTDLYASSRWCQAEIREAKCAGVPVVILDALGRTEARGSFLMDHVPRIPIRDVNGRWVGRLVGVAVS
jgi:TIR domain